MLIPKENIKTVYKYLINGTSSYAPCSCQACDLEGVLVVKKDVRAPKHPEISVPNLQVMKALQSLKSRGYVTEQFSWQYHYFFLTDEGLLFLRQYLHLPESVVPVTIAKAQRSGAARRGGMLSCIYNLSIFPSEESGERRERGEDYRRGGWRGNEAKVAA